MHLDHFYYSCPSLSSTHTSMPSRSWILTILVLHTHTCIFLWGWMYAHTADSFWYHSCMHSYTMSTSMDNLAGSLFLQEKKISLISHWLLATFHLGILGSKTINVSISSDVIFTSCLINASEILWVQQTLCCKRQAGPVTFAVFLIHVSHCLLNHRCRAVL